MHDTRQGTDHDLRPGGPSLLVPPDVRVIVSGFNLIGGQRVDDPGATGPVLTVRAYGIMGGVRVRHAAG